jgi:hypothetical protein
MNWQVGCACCSGRLGIYMQLYSLQQRQLHRQAGKVQTASGAQQHLLVVKAQRQVGRGRRDEGGKEAALLHVCVAQALCMRQSSQPADMCTAPVRLVPTKTAA